MHSCRLIFGVAAAVLSACGSMQVPLPAGPPSTSGPPVDSGMVVGRAYVYSLYIHCGVVSTQIDGRTFYADSPTGVRSSEFSGSGARPNDVGTMTLTSHGVAVFRDGSGATVRFVDHVPVEPGRGYRIEVFLAGPGQLGSTWFAGDLFVPGEVTSGRLRLPDGATTVTGTMTLDDPDTAHFAVGGAVVRYDRLTTPVGCA